VGRQSVSVIAEANLAGIFWAYMPCFAAPDSTEPFQNVSFFKYFVFIGLSIKWMFFNVAASGFGRAQTSKCLFTSAVVYVIQMF